MQNFEPKIDNVTVFLHMLFGWLFGATAAGLLTVWFFFGGLIELRAWLLVIGVCAIIFGAVAAIWRNKFWAALADNPLFALCKAMIGVR